MQNLDFFTKCDQFLLIVSMEFVLICDIPIVAVYISLVSSLYGMRIRVTTNLPFNSIMCWSFNMLVLSTCTIFCHQADIVTITALLKQQGLNTKGILKSSPTKEEIPPLPNSSGKIEVFLIPIFPNFSINSVGTHLVRVFTPNIHRFLGVEDGR